MCFKTHEVILLCVGTKLETELSSLILSCLQFSRINFHLILFYDNVIFTWFQGNLHNNMYSRKYSLYLLLSIPFSPTPIYNHYFTFGLSCRVLKMTNK